MRSKTWETRLAAGLAVEVITKNVRIRDSMKVLHSSKCEVKSELIMINKLDVILKLK